ncbi:MAG: amino acid adenylation domain-containing protein, partial [Bacteroidota bacterium]
LPSDYARPTIKTYNGASLNTIIPAETLNGLLALCQGQGATLFMGLTALVKSLLYRYTGQEDMLIGTPVAGRAHPDLHDQIGFYVNTVVLRNRLKGEDSFETLLNAVKTNTLAAFEHETYPFDRLVEDLDLPRDLSRSAVFDVMLVLQNNEQSELRFGDVALSVEGAETGISKFDLTFSFVETANGLLMGLEYNTDLFKSDRIARLAKHLETLLGSVLHDSKAAIGGLNLLPEQERNLLLYDFNDTAADYPKDKTIVQLFEEQVKKTPDKVAVVFEGRTLSYRELNEQSNQLGYYLRDTYDIRPDDIVALQLERSEWMIVAIMGVLKSGAAYLPIALDIPATRLAYMLQDSKAKVLLTDNIVFEGAKAFQIDLPNLAIEHIRQTIVTWGATHNPACINNSRSLAYVIYTSGSTGQPKGVMIEHAGVVNLAQSQIDYFGLQTGDSMLQFAAYTFDASVSEIMSTLLSGARLVLFSEASKSPEQVLELIGAQKISWMTLPPAFLSNFDKSALAQMEHLKVLVTAGDKPLMEDIKALNKQLRYINAYGPTEYSVCISAFEVPKDWNESYVPVGKPIHHTEVLILDERLGLCPIGIVGELCVSGIGMARGYLNRPELSAERFVPHPFKIGERMYKTGDYARWMPDGNVEFLGRIDQQLKVRGYRIEAGEIEQALLEHPSVQSCVVVGYAFEQGKELVAYFVLKSETTLPDATILRSFLGNTLPDYMIPSYFVELESLPMTSSGKVDRKALPAPHMAQLASGTVYVAPRNAIENQLVEIWQQVLGREQIGVEDNFFSLGGHSLRAIRVVSLIRQAFSVEMRLSEIFTHPTIAGLAKRIQTESKNNFKMLESIPRVTESTDYALSNAQRRLWVLDQMSETAEAQAAYNMPAALRLRGDLDIAALEQVLDLLFERHESLRTQFRDGRQVIVQAAPYQLPQRDGRGLSAAA